MEEANRLGDYLLAQGMDNSVEEGGSGWSIWVHHDDHLDRAKGEFDAFVNNSADAKYVSAAQTAEHLRTKKEKEEQRRQKNFVDVRTSWAAVGQGSRPLTLAMVLISCLVYAAEFVGSSRVREPEDIAQNVRLLNPLRITPVLVEEGQGFSQRIARGAAGTSVAPGDADLHPFWPSAPGVQYVLADGPGGND